MVDYSKWDKLELSDDSDVEVHPNVDKASFIRWKQRDIHEKRERRGHEIDELAISIDTNEALMQRMEKLLALPIGDLIHAGVDGTVELSRVATEDKTKAKEYDEMIESLIDQIESQSEADYTKNLKDHKVKLSQVIEQQRKRYAELKEESTKYITSEDLKTGFDSFHLNKVKKATPAKPLKKESAKVQEVETINKPSATPNTSPTSHSTTVSSSAVAKSTATDDLEEPEAYEETLEFANIPMGDLRQCYEYVTKHPFIVSEEQKDAIIMLAFQQKLKGQTQMMKRYVYNALLLQYCASLGKDGINLFFNRIMAPNHPALQAFMKDVDFTVNHIENRCKILAQESNEDGEDVDGVEQIQLHAVDPNTEIVINVPAANSEEEAFFHTFSSDMQTAIMSKDLTQINKVLGELSVEEAEDYIAKFNEIGVLSVEEKILDATEWQKNEYAANESYDGNIPKDFLQSVIEGQTPMTEQKEDEVLSTADIVD
ncbi:hypothetical protein NADFUDRAFT_83186 [Nadsonia fulvescens var. elongata DSM 6958]|uniref:Hsp90 chaperone protein kinase-targeting subunit n=1 Tax=Nadsonia fulvescens var. elongata DSM 6958 TaxID=857566 RepID=A0A1E3PI68_9ASCO|nr:hypothetical protein NADFUDRAFT_83186 [Nadsonia fulvescens var. elongata DSM 6958]